MLVVAILVTATQVNRIFPIDDVMHLVRGRTVPSKIEILKENNPTAKAMIVPTAQPRRAILSLKSSRIHLFLHDCTRFRRCVWDGDMSYDDKKEIVTNMIRWLNQTEFQTEHLFSDDEDELVFSEAIDDLERTAFS